jgi:putative pyruvate formate lyase activating enzyme
MMCDLCPRKCNVDRSVKAGFCGTGIKPVVAKAFLHRWEEPCISGTNGSGTVFFSGCNLKCIYCQNYTISQEHFGKEISTDALRNIFFSLQQKGAHNINLVNPTHAVTAIKESLTGTETLGIPVIYNTNGYDSMACLKLMEGLVDVYLPDIKYIQPDTAASLSNARDYFNTSSVAVLEMYRQVGAPVFHENGLIQKGLIIRHLILPGHTAESISILDWIKTNLPEDVHISLMSQYTPLYKAKLHPQLNRRITRREYDRVVNHLFKIGLENGYVQERDSAEEGEYIPDFNLEGVE